MVININVRFLSYLMDDGDNDLDTFLEKFDTEWVRYNRDLIEKVRKFYEEHPEKQTEGGEES